MSLRLFSFAHFRQVSKKKIECILDELIMPLPWVKEVRKELPIAQLPPKPKPVATATPPTVKPKAEEPQKIAPKVSIGKLGKRLNTGGISIKETLKAKEEEQNTALNTAKTPFTKDELMVLWNEQAAFAKAENKKSYHASLTQKEPVLKDNFLIEVYVNNKVQEETIQKEKPVLLEFLRERLNNYSIEIQTVVKQMKNEVHLYTDRDKFKELVKVNPDLMYLKEKFNLDFEF